jgi:hypothetical protein
MEGLTAAMEFCSTKERGSCEPQHGILSEDKLAETVVAG